jgi:hypothetical protein
MPENMLLAAVENGSSDAAAKQGANKPPLPASSAQVSEAFKAMDAESEAVLKQVLNLSSDLAIIKERENNPAKFQLVVMVTLQPTNLFELDFMELRIDKQVVTAYHYTDEDVSALSKGGGQRLYLANLPAGMHELQATMVGKIPRDPEYSQEASFSFISGVSRNVIELRITGEKNKGFPTIVPKEWN